MLEVMEGAPDGLEVGKVGENAEKVATLEGGLMEEVIAGRQHCPLSTLGTKMDKHCSY